VERAQAAREEKARVERAQAAREEKARVERAQAARADTDTQMIRPEAKQSTSVVPVNSFAAPLIIHDEISPKCWVKLVYTAILLTCRSKPLLVLAHTYLHNLPLMLLSLFSI